MKIKRIIIGLFLTVYLIVAVFLTVCLLSYNQYNISVFGDKSFVIVKNNDFEPDYKKGTLLIVTKNKNDDIKVNDDIFFYNKYKNQITVSHSKVTNTEKLSDVETTYTITGDYYVSSENVIGKADTTKVIDGWGSILAFLESRWGFLFIIVLPISVLFIYEIYVIVKEIVKPETEEEKIEKKEEPITKPEPVEEKPLPVVEEEPVVEEKSESVEEAAEPVEEKPVEVVNEPVVEETKEEVVETVNEVSATEPVAEVTEDSEEKVEV